MVFYASIRSEERGARWVLTPILARRKRWVSKLMHVSFMAVVSCTLFGVFYYLDAESKLGYAGMFFYLGVVSNLHYHTHFIFSNIFYL